jgi:hypothetical protein
VCAGCRVSKLLDVFESIWGDWVVDINNVMCGNLCSMKLIAPAEALIRYYINSGIL